MATFILPLVNIPQTFDISLAAIVYTVTCRWNSAPDAGWVLDFVDTESNTPLCANVPLITGGNCLAGLDYLGFGGQLIVYTDGDETAVPTLDNLGVESNLYFVTEDT